MAGQSRGMETTMVRISSYASRLGGLLALCAALALGICSPARAETLDAGGPMPAIGESALLTDQDDDELAPDDYMAEPDANDVGADSGAGGGSARSYGGVTISGLKYWVNSDGTAYISSYEGESGEIVVPSSIDGHTVTEIASDAFYGLHITSVTLPNTITKIDSQAFHYTSITQITLPESLQELGWRAFWGCNNLTTLNIPAGLEPMQNEGHTTVAPSGEGYMRTYYYNPVVACDSFTGFTVSSGSANYKAVDGVLFSKDGSVLYSWPFGRNIGGPYTVPQGTKVIADEAFAGVKGLTSITFPNTLEKICDWSFYETELKSLYLPDSVKEVQANAFEGCRSLESVRLSSGMRKVFNQTFVDCTSLNSVTNTRGIEEIGWRAFAAYDSPLSSFEFGDDVTFIATEAFLATKVSEDSYPDYLTKTGLGNYVIAESVVVSGQRNYDYARDVVDAVNKERAAEGLGSLSMDAELTQIAMQRAAETALYFAHTRPDGSDCFSASDRVNAENIAAGSSTPAGVMDQWMNSSGHRANILGSEWSSIGVGCVKVGSVTYWVQVFGIDKASGSIPTGTLDDTFEILVVNNTVPFEDASGFNLHMWQEDPEPLEVGETYELVVGIYNQGWEGTFCPTDASGYTWKSSNPKVVSVGADGIVRAVGTGSATVSATSRGGYTWTKNFKVESISTDVMYRLYNKWTGEHFYTASEKERDSLTSVGWTYEGMGWTAPSKSKTPVWRLYNPYVDGGDHHYTLSAHERDVLVGEGWRSEGVGWYSDDDKGVALYRQYNPYAETGTHNYTADINERYTLIELGWRDEGIAWYGVKQ